MGNVARTKSNEDVLGFRKRKYSWGLVERLSGAESEGRIVIRIPARLNAVLLVRVLFEYFGKRFRHMREGKDGKDTLGRDLFQQTKDELRQRFGYILAVCYVLGELSGRLGCEYEDWVVS